MNYCVIGNEYKLKISNGTNKPFSTYTIIVSEEDLTHIKGIDRDGVLRIFAKTNIIEVKGADF